MPSKSMAGAHRGLGLCVRVAAICGLLAAYSGFVNFVGGTGLRPSVRSVALWAEGGGATLEKKPTAQNEYRLNVGRAIDVLRRDMVGLFEKSQHVPDFSIYSPNIEVIDARLPSFQLRGLATYQQVLSTMQWSIRTACDSSKMEITSLTPPVNDQMYVRWRLKLWFKDVRSLFAPAFGGSPVISMEGPFIVEGYSRYQFDPWSAEIVKHTIDITNPPMYLSDLVGQYARTPSWLMPVNTGMSMPSMARGWPMLQSFRVEEKEPSTLTGSSANSAGGKGSRSGPARNAGGWLPGLPQGCEDDFECNDGKANFPLQCCEMPLLGKFCCEPPDDFAQGVPDIPAYLPLPVPVDDKWSGGEK
mmetsp:Transcript_39476/g.91253  ORF Transcript_39476/g.91253 Transcript_39476/m.91253 type:complete len:358 (+) Transcript_39476:73-1146(+)